MSVARACASCRAAKAKCDLVRPTCGRCAQRGILCYGQSQEGGFIFQDENSVAQRNSERARRGRRRNRSPLHVVELRELSNSARLQQRLLKQLYPWLVDRILAELPPQLDENLDDRAVHAFFLDWTLYPRNDGTSPGHMYHLPTLYVGAVPGSLLWHAVRAMAFANMSHHEERNNTHSVKALKQYGEALAELRNVLSGGQPLKGDYGLAALLLIDSFESMYLGRTEPLGPHIPAIKQILQLEVETQPQEQSSFSLWLTAYHRLQARQILLREKPDPQQQIWLTRVKTDSMPFRILVDIQRMSTLAAAVNGATKSDEITAIRLFEKYAELAQLVQDITTTLTSVQNAMLVMAASYKPETRNTDETLPRWEVEDVPQMPIPEFKCPRLLHHDDIWLAYMWNCYSASQIVLRESLVDLVEHITTLRRTFPDYSYTEMVEEQKSAISVLAGTIIRTFPQLLGWIHADERSPYFPHHGKIAGRFLALFAMCAIKRARLASPEHKETARQVIEWIYASQALR